MTPEDVLEKHNLINGFAVEAFTERVVAAMEEYAGELKAENEKMREVLKQIDDELDIDGIDPYSALHYKIKKTIVETQSP
jgi:hypothetical protein